MASVTEVSNTRDRINRINYLVCDSTIVRRLKEIEESKPKLSKASLLRQIGTDNYCWAVYLPIKGYWKVKSNTYRVEL